VGKGMIFRPEEEMKNIQWKKSVKGSPGVWIQDFVTNKENTQVTVRYVKVEPNGEIIPHTHDVLEVFYIVEGKGELLMGDKRLVCSKGSCLIAPAGVRHGLKNIQDIPILLFCVFTPPLSE